MRGQGACKWCLLEQTDLEATVKHAVRDAGTFVASVLGSFIIGFILFHVLKEPCPPVIVGDQSFSIGECVGSTTFEAWMKGSGAVGTVAGVILAFISELLPADGQPS